MKISVVIPAYNEEKYIADSLRAILAQDYPDFEVIVVDNASTDRTSEIARSFPGVKVLLEGNKGTMWACERGRKEAAGELVVRMDADCLPGRQWLTTGARLFKDESIAGATGPYDYYDGGFFVRYFALYYQKYLYVLFSYILWKMKAGAIMIGGNSFIRASALERAGGFGTEYVFYGDDTDTARRVMKSGRIIFSGKLVIKTSARRFKADGFFYQSYKYFIECFRVLLENRT